MTELVRLVLLVERSVKNFRSRGRLKTEKPEMGTEREKVEKIFHYHMASVHF